MKLARLCIFVSTVVLGGLFSAHGSPFDFTNGNLILGIQATGGTGASQNVFFNLGSAVSHRDNGDLGQIGNIGNTLAFVYGSDWYSREDLYFGVIGNLNGNPTSGIGSAGPVNGDPSRTFYISQPVLSPGQSTPIAEASYPSASLGSAGTFLSGMEGMLVGSIALPGLTAEADDSAVLDQTEQSVEWSNGWTARNPVPGAAFGIFTGGIQQNFGRKEPATYVDVLRILATNTGANPAGVVGGGTYETSIAISSNGTISATTTAVASNPEISVQLNGSELKSGKSKSFGTVVVDNKSSAKTFTIKNTGTARLTDLDISKTGVNKGDFTVTPLTVTSLGQDKTTTFKVTFKPSAQGTRNAVIKIESNDSNENPFVIKLAGMGS